MRWIVAVLLAVHGLIHVMGFAKAFGYAELPQLTQPVSREMGLAWLAAALLVVASAGMMVAWPRSFWIVGAVALVTSQAVIQSAWSDAWAGTIVNVVLLLAVAQAWFTYGPQSFADQPTRLFLMHARMFGLPVEVFHRRIAARTVRARFTDGGQTISATLLFGEDGRLTNFISDDRSRSSPDGKTFTRLRFSTPIRDYRDFGSARLARATTPTSMRARSSPVTHPPCRGSGSLLVDPRKHARDQHRHAQQSNRDTDR